MQVAAILAEQTQMGLGALFMCSLLLTVEHYFIDALWSAKEAYM